MHMNQLNKNVLQKHESSINQSIQKVKRHIVNDMSSFTQTYNA